MGGFFKGNAASAIYNASFQPFTSPVPFLLVRLGVVDDWKRLTDRLGALGHSAEDFGADWVVLKRDSLGDLTAEIDAWRQAGGTHVRVDTVDRGFESAGDHIGYLTSVADALDLP